MVIGNRGYVQRSHSETWYDIKLPPNCEREALLKSVFLSAEGSTSVRAIVCKGRFGERFSRACRAASFEEVRAASRGGDAYLDDLPLLGFSCISSPSAYLKSSDIAVADEKGLLLGGNEACCCCCCCCRRQHGFVLDRAESNCPLHLSSRNLFIELYYLT